MRMRIIGWVETFNPRAPKKPPSRFGVQGFRFKLLGLRLSV